MLNTWRELTDIGPKQFHNLITGQEQEEAGIIFDESDQS